MMRLRAWLVLALGCCCAAAADRDTLDGKVLVGYQGWFTCPSDGSGRWTHWSRGVPSPTTLTVDLFPDVSELEPDERCALPGMTVGGKPAYVFSSRNAKTVLRHFRWMAEHGIDGALVQRFVGSIARSRADGDLVLKNVMAAAAATGRTFAIEYDISGGDPEAFARILREDWTYLVQELHMTGRPQYQRHNGKPLVSVWGMGLNEARHPPEDPVAALELIRWFRERATFMGGTPSRWRTLNRDARTDATWAEVYAAMDIVQPWTVGRYGSPAAADRWKDEMLVPDLKRAAENKQAYMPVVFPGFSWRNLKPGAEGNQIPRLRGEFLWRQAYNARTAGARMLKIAMFDEVDEGTAIFKAAAKRADAPEQGYWLTLDADGARLPSDWYLRVAGAITRMFHGDAEPVRDLPLKPE